MSESGQFETYSDYFSYLWQKLGTGQPDPQTLTRLIAAEGSWMQEPDATAATARPNLDEVDGWARKIEGTKAFSRMMENPKLGKRIRVGATVPMMTNDGRVVPGRVLEINDEKVKMDFNHELAGKTLHFTGEVLAVREATDKELAEGLHGELAHHCSGN